MILSMKKKDFQKFCKNVNNNPMVEIKSIKSKPQLIVVSLDAPDFVEFPSYVKVL
ncbi:hypothetical protein [Erwinia phage FBB1]|nr:hypothetical protein [Erwinia phage FBB1]